MYDILRKGDGVVERKTPKKYIDNITRYQKENTKQVCVRFHKVYDADILEQLNSIPAKATYIKELIRRDMSYNKGDK